MLATLRLPIVATLALTATGCAASYGDPDGAAEPIVVTNAVFHAGKMPDDGGPQLLLTSSMSSSGSAGGPEKAMSGRATSAAYGVAVQMKDQGSGYWVVPVGLPDLVDPGIAWALKFRFTHTAPLGQQFMVAAQTDKLGKFGKPTEIPFTIKSLTPSGKKVISLVWNNHADLDLQVQSPLAQITSAKHPNTGEVPADHKIPDGGIPGSGTYNRDSNARCSFDGIMEEDVVWTSDPTPGDYLVWVDLYDSCGEAATTFELQLWEDDVKTWSKQGQLLELNADNGTGAGLYMNTFSF